jgi:hypothetical protein
MLLKNVLAVGFTVALAHVGIFTSAIHAQSLLNVDFGAGRSSGKAGIAATGLSSSDFWNFYTRDDGNGGYRTFGGVSNLKWSDGTASAVGLTVANAPGAWHNGAADPMYDIYVYPFDGGNITVTVTNLPAGSYDFYLYGHGGPGVDTQNSVFEVLTGGHSYGTKATTSGPGWISATWQEGQQYVLFQDVGVATGGGPVTITVSPGASPQASLNGIQIVQKASTPPPPPVAGGLLDIDFGAGTSSAKVGMAATGRTGNDFWNFYTRDDGNGGYRIFGGVSNLKWSDGTASAVGLTVANAPGAWHNGAADPMYDIYVYPFDGGNITVTVTNLPAGSYDFYLYGHGGPGVDTQNSVFEVSSGTSYGHKATTTTSGWTSPMWQEGVQYVVFGSVEVLSGQAVTVRVVPGASGYAIISGMQIVQRALVTLSSSSAEETWSTLPPRTLPKLAVAASSLSVEGYKFSLSGDPGLSYSIEASTDLINWAPLETVTNGSGGLSWVDSAATNLSHRFYRAKQQ